MKRILRCAALLLAALCLCGCSAGVNVDTILTPPKLSAEQEQIYQALKDATGSGISLKYPKSGSYLSAFIVANIDADPENEAIVFYEKSSVPALNSGLRINVLDCIDGKWLSVCDRSAEGSEIEKVVISKLGDSSRTNIIVGYSTANQSEKYVSIYSYSNSYLDLTFSRSYAVFDISTPPEGKNPDLLLLGAATATEQAFAAVYRLDSEGLYHEYRYRFNDSYTDYNQLIYGNLSGSNGLLYVDAASGTAELRTEILCMQQEQLVNQLERCGKSVAETARRTGLSSIDIDGDGIPEIPVQSVFRGYEDAAESEQILETRWLMMEDDKLFTEHYSYYNVNDGYAFLLPEQWVGRVTVVKDTVLNEMQICPYDGEWSEDMPVLLHFGIVYDESEMKARLADGYLLLHTKGNARYMMKAETEHPLSAGIGDLLLCFRFIG